MIKLTATFLAVLAVSFAILASSSTNNQQHKNVIIDSVIVKEKELKDICFVIHKSTIPKISGLLDKDFQNQLNQIFSNNFYSYIEIVKKKYGRCTDAEYTDEYLFAEIPASASGSFEVMTNNDSIISIVQYRRVLFGHGGNGWSPSSYSLTADFKNKIIYGKDEFKIDRYRIDYFNNKIKIFFDKLFPEDSTIDYPLIKTENDYNNLSFGHRNDSLMLIIEACPSSQASLGTYIIPIDQIKSKMSD